MAFPTPGQRKPFWPGKFGTPKKPQIGPKQDFGMPEEFGIKPKAKMMADGGMGGSAGAPPDPTDPDADSNDDSGMGDAPPSDLDPVTLHYVIGLLQHLADSSVPPDDGMGGDDTGGAPPPSGGPQFGGQ